MAEFGENSPANRIRAASASGDDDAVPAPAGSRIADKEKT